MIKNPKVGQFLAWRENGHTYFTVFVTDINTLVSEFSAVVVEVDGTKCHYTVGETADDWYAAKYAEANCWFEVTPKWEQND